VSTIHARSSINQLACATYDYAKPPNEVAFLCLTLARNLLQSSCDEVLSYLFISNSCAKCYGLSLRSHYVFDENKLGCRLHINDMFLVETKIDPGTMVSKLTKCAVTVK